MRKIWLVLTILAATITGSGLLESHTQLPILPSVHAATSSISLVGYAFTGWNHTNPTITVVQGSLVTIALSSGDGISHEFVLDVAGAGKSSSPMCPPDACSQIFPPGTTISFTANFAVGVYTYYCLFHPSTMFGQFIVQAAGPSTSDFTISSNPASLTVQTGSSASSTITLTSVNGFSNTVSLSATVSPGGPIVSVSPVSVTLGSGGSAAATLTASAPSGGLYSSPDAQGSYTVTVTAAGGSSSHSTPISLTVGSASPSSAGAMGLRGSGSLDGATLGIGVVVAIVVVAAAGYLLRRRARAK